MIAMCEKLEKNASRNIDILYLVFFRNGLLITYYIYKYVTCH